MGPERMKRRGRDATASVRGAEPTGRTRARPAKASGPRSRAQPSSPRVEHVEMLAMLGGEASLGNISADTRAKLIAASRTLRVAAGRVLFHKGDAPDCCYLILKGAVKVSLPSKDGQDTLLAVLGRGDMVGEMALLDQQPRSATVTALKSCELCQLPTTTLEWLAREDTAVFRQLLTVLSARVRASNEISHIQQMPLKARLARALLRLAQGFGERLPDGRVLIRQKLSQAELGRMVGAARENINRQVADWSKAKVLSRVSGYYCIQSLQALERLADLDAR